MRKNALTVNDGLSLSQAQSISNLCNQRAREIDTTLEGINNCSKSVAVDGNSLNIMVGKKIPSNVLELLLEKSELHGCQAFLMENIKAKDLMIKEMQKSKADISSVEIPEKPVVLNAAPVLLREVSEEWGWEQLTSADLAKYYEAEAYAAHIGQFIHAGSTLDNLRKELPRIVPVEWMTIVEGKKSPVKVTVHHTSAELLEIHEKLAAEHRKYEQVVNYYKAKVKNLVTEENARIAKLNADVQHNIQKQNNDNQLVYETGVKAANEKIRTIQLDYEKLRQDEIKKIASMRISVDARFQKVVDIFLEKLEPEK
jgi:hypothetical protein